MKKALYITMVLAFIAVLGWAQSVSFAQPTTMVNLGLLVDMTTQTPSNMIMTGISIGSLDLQLGFSKTQIAFFPCITGGGYFAGLLVTQTLPTDESAELGLALPVGIQFKGPSILVRIGYAYPLTPDLGQGFFVEFALQADVGAILQTKPRGPPE